MHLHQILWENNGVGNFTAGLVLAIPAVTVYVRKARKLERALVAQAAEHKEAIVAAIGKLAYDALRHHATLRTDVADLHTLLRPAPVPAPSTADTEQANEAP